MRSSGWSQSRRDLPSPSRATRRSLVTSLYASPKGPFEGLRGALDEVGVDDMPPELLIEIEFHEDIGTYHGSFTMADKLISYIVAALTVNE